jgi:hypothetical protein
MKIRVLQTYPLRMNVALEILTDWKGYLGTLPLADLLFPSGFFLSMVAPLHFTHLVKVISGDFF